MYTNPQKYPHVEYCKERRKQPLEPNTTEHILPEDHPAARGLHRNPGPILGLFQARPDPLELTEEEKDPLLRYQPFATAADPYGLNDPEAPPFIYPDPNLLQRQQQLNLEAPNFTSSSILPTNFEPQSSTSKGSAPPGIEQVGPLPSTPRASQTPLQTSSVLHQSQRALVEPRLPDARSSFTNEFLHKSHEPQSTRHSKQTKQTKQPKPRPKPRSRLAASKLSREVILSPERQLSSQETSRHFTTALAFNLSAASRPVSKSSNAGIHKAQEDPFATRTYRSQHFKQDSSSPNHPTPWKPTSLLTETGLEDPIADWNVFLPGSPASHLTRTALADPKVVRESLVTEFLAPWELQAHTTEAKNLETLALSPRIPMPYNNSAIPPTEETTGTATLPCKLLSNSNDSETETLIVARVKKILAIDEDISAVSANASFAITIATVSISL